MLKYYFHLISGHWTLFMVSICLTAALTKPQLRDRNPPTSVERALDWESGTWVLSSTSVIDSLCDFEPVPDLSFTIC